MQTFSSFQIPQVGVLTLCLFPYYPIVWESFLQHWLYRNSAIFQLIFHENFSTCRGIFYMFVGGHERCILLLYHIGRSFDVIFLSIICGLCSMG